MKQNYRTKLGLGYEEAKFNYLINNNSQFSCFYYDKKNQNIAERITNLLLLLITLYKEYVPAFTQEDDSVDG